MIVDPVIEIRPEVAIYAAFARLNYRPWYALAEFVDNSLQSYLANRERLGASQLEVFISLGNDSIEIRDTAAGIAWQDFGRAFQPANPPPDTTGLSEYGLGLKAAASWFSRHWQVRTKAYGEAVERTITFDIPTITATRVDKLPVSEMPAQSSTHYTILSLQQLNVSPRARTIDKIKRHLSSIYRLFLQEGVLALYINDAKLEYQTPELLHAPHFMDLDGPSLTWRREFCLALDENHRVSGWAGILRRASVANAGFAIFRRGRLIEGSYGEAYRPEVLFRKSNSYTYQRLVGELFVDGFSVSHTKDGIQWSEWEDDVLAWLRHELDEPPISLLKQAEGHRVGRQSRTIDLRRVTTDTQRVVAQRVPPLINDQLGQRPDAAPLPSVLSATPVAAHDQSAFHVEHGGEEWIVHIELADDEQIYPWLDVAGARGAGQRELRIRLNIAHPFMVRFSTPARSELPLLTRLAVGIAIAEATARSTGVDRAGTLRRNLNQLLRDALAAPVEELHEINNEVVEDDDGGSAEGAR